MRVCLIAFLSLAALSLAPAARAAPDNHPCKEDAKKFCADVEPGRGALVKCLKAHEAELSPACKERGAELRKEKAHVEEACEADRQKYCADKKTGTQEALECMRAHKPQLSEGCKAAAEHAHAKVEHRE